MKKSTVQHIAQLANIPISQLEEETLATAFTQTLQVVDALKKIDVKNVTPTSQVTGLENVLREDVVDESRMFTQKEALMNAAQKYNEYVVVNQILDQE